MMRLRPLLRPHFRLYLKGGVLQVLPTLARVNMARHPQLRDVGLVVGQTAAHWIVQVSGLCQESQGVAAVPREDHDGKD